MKLGLLLLAFVAYVTSVPVDEHLPNTPKEYPRYMQIPDEEGNLHEVDLEAEPDQQLLDEITRNPADNQYFLFTRRNRLLSQTLIINNANSVQNSNFDASHPIIVIVHGWLSSRLTSINPTIRNAYLNRAETNVIVVDWSRLAASDYITAVSGVPAIGRGVGQFLRFLNQVTGVAFNRMHLVGYSLGAHVVGNAGRELGGQVARVTGLDPAGPLWNFNSNRLMPSDGIYVEGIHTDGGLSGLGIGSNVGNADFYPNGGITQPGCSTSICNHERAWQFFASSVTYNHLLGNRCDNNLQITNNQCFGETFPLGNSDLNKFGSGMYRVNTLSAYPF